MPITQRCRRGSSKPLLYRREGIGETDEQRGCGFQDGICISSLYTARAAAPLSARDAFLSEGGHMLFCSHGSVPAPPPHPPPSPPLLTLQRRRGKALAQFAANEINWSGDKGVKCCGAAADGRPLVGIGPRNLPAKGVCWEENIPPAGRCRCC